MSRQTLVHMIAKHSTKRMIRHKLCRKRYPCGVSSDQTEAEDMRPNTASQYTPLDGGFICASVGRGPLNALGRPVASNLNPFQGGPLKFQWTTESVVHCCGPCTTCQAAFNIRGVWAVFKENHGAPVVPASTMMMTVIVMKLTFLWSPCSIVQGFGNSEKRYN